MDKDSNPYCSALRIPVPSLGDVRDHREANTFSLLLVALLEHGGPMTLADVAERFEEAGIAGFEDALRSLKRCRPARPPVYRDDDRYALDPHDETLDRWAFRLSLRPPKVPRLQVVRPKLEAPLPGPDEPLTAAELEEAFRGERLFSNWSAQRLAISVLDANGGPLPGSDVIAAMDRLAEWHKLQETSAKHWGRGAPITATDGGNWNLDAGHWAVRSAREAVRKFIEKKRRQQARRPDPSVIAATIRHAERRRAAHAAELARLRRALLHVFPEKTPEAAVLVDVTKRELKTYMHSEFDELRAGLTGFDVIGAVKVRQVLRALEFKHGQRRLAELRPPQKTRRLNRAGRTLKIALSLLVSGSCGISRPFAETKRLRGYLDKGETTRFHRRLEADAKSLFAVYQYGRLHGFVRLRWGFLDEVISVPWKHMDEPTLYSLIRKAHEQGRDMELVAGSAPGWADPWSRVRRCAVEKIAPYDFLLIDERGGALDPIEVQLARIAAP